MIEAFEVSKVDASTHSANHIQLIDDHTLIATEVECTFSVESSEEREHVGDIEIRLVMISQSV